LSRPILLGSALVVLAAALFGTLSYVARSADAVGVGALPFVSWRAILATAVLLAATLVLSARGAARLPDPRQLGRGRQVALTAAALCGALLNVAMFAAFLRTTIAVALICFYTFPAIVTLASVRFYGERLDRSRLAALLLSSAGLLLVLTPVVQQSDVVIDFLGIGLALFAAVCQAAFVLISGRGFRPFRSIHVATYVIGAAVVVSVGLAVAAGDVGGLLLPLTQSDAWIWILAGGLLGAAIPTTAFLAGIGLIGPSRAAILMTIEPLVGVTLAGLLLGEQPTIVQLVGGAAVLVAAAILQTAPRAPAPQEQEYPRLV